MHALIAVVDRLVVLHGGGLIDREGDPAAVIGSRRCAKSTWGSPPMPEPLLAVRALDAFYGDFQALFGVSLEVAPGEVVAVIGANGAGKSTLLKCIAGPMPSRRDAILFDGEPIGDQPAHAVVARGIALVPEGRRLFPVAHGRGEPPDRRPARPPWAVDPGARLRAVPGAGRAPAACRARRSPAASSRWSRSAAR